MPYRINPFTGKFDIFGVNSGVTAGTYGSGGAVVPTITIDANGRITSASNTTISISYGNVYDFQAGVELYSTGISRAKAQALAQGLHP